MKELEILMADRCTKAEAENYLSKSSSSSVLIYENPEEWIQSLKDCGCYEGQTISEAKNNSYPDISVVNFENHEYLIEYAN